MNPVNHPSSASVFRTEAWVQAWIDTWGKDPLIRLIDLGGRNHPLECVYLIKHRLKKIIPINTLCLAGAGFGAMSTPRAEYNNLDSLIAMAGNTQYLQQELDKLRWLQFAVTDIDATSITPSQMEQLTEGKNWQVHVEKSEPAYAVQATSFGDYTSGLGASARLTYFNRRERLAQSGEISFQEFGLAQANMFFEILNKFHVQRWGRPCYSPVSQVFMKNFLARLADEGGTAVMQAMRVNNETVSVIFDVIWQGTRFNFQSGYAENRFEKIALGSLHLGYSIEAALNQGYAYDFMAGTGKHSNYKERVANHQIPLVSLHLQRRFMRALQLFKNAKNEIGGRYLNEC